MERWFTISRILVVTLILCMSLTGTVSAEPSAPARNRTQMAQDVYIYGLPMVIMDVTRGVMTAVPGPGPRQAPVNQFLHANGTPTYRFLTIVRPNVDTLYSVAFLNVSDEPMVLSVPDTGGRYYLMQVMDAWTNVIGSPGPRTTGTGAGIFLISGPGWNGKVPAGMQQIRSPTAMVWILGRTLVRAEDPADFNAARAAQVQFRLTPLSAWGTAYTPPDNVPVDPSVDLTLPPRAQVANMTPEEYYSRLSRVLAKNPPAPADDAMAGKMAVLGIVPGRPFDWNSTDAETKEALKQGAAGGLSEVIAAARVRQSATASTNYWHIMNTSGTYGTRYLDRAVMGWTNTGANLPEDCVYSLVFRDSDGQPLDGAYRYVIHFPANGTPPVRGFWSITVYTSRLTLVNNSANRYMLGDRSPLRYNPDGSLDLWIQMESPGRERESNWIPAPEGSFNIFLRQYWPEEPVRDMTWIPPAVIRLPVTPAAGSGIPVESAAGTHRTTEATPLPFWPAVAAAAGAFLLTGRKP